MSTFELTQLQYSQNLHGPFALYIYGHGGYGHTGCQWFSKKIRYPDEEISVAAAKIRVMSAEAAGQEVRICDGGDMLVYHSRNGRTDLMTKFWEAIEA